MKVYIVIAEDREEINFDDGECCLDRNIYGVYLLESFADAAVIEAKAKHDFAFVEEHFVE